jgi:hypothetical protein
MTILERGSVTKLPCFQDSDKRHDYFNLIDPHQLIDCVEWMNANDAIHIDIAFTVLNKLHEGVQEGMGWPIGQWEPRPPLSPEKSEDRSGCARATRGVWIRSSLSRQAFLC